MFRQLGVAVCITLLLCVFVSCNSEKAAAPKGNPVAGGKIFQEQCAFCHSDTRDEARIGPSLKGLYSRQTLPRRGVPVTDENVRRAIEEGASPAGLPPMPAYRDVLKPNEIDDLVAYLRTL